jgi:hypothetical protein
MIRIWTIFIGGSCICFSLLPNHFTYAQVELINKITDTSKNLSKAVIIIPTFERINPDTLKIGEFDELIVDSYSALGMPNVYDALHSFQTRRSDNFGGHFNDKINLGLEQIRKKGFKSDVKQLFIQIDPKIVTVYWFAVVGPSSDGNNYLSVNSRGSAGGGIQAVQKQLPAMHELNPTMTSVKLLEYNEDVIKCFDWDGKPLSLFTDYINIRQHFYKYYENEVIINPVIEDSTKKNESDKEFAKLQESKERTINVSQIKYTVKAGDNLTKISIKHHTSVSKIKKANGLISDLIRIGQVLKIP